MGDEYKTYRNKFPFLLTFCYFYIIYTYFYHLNRCEFIVHRLIIEECQNLLDIFYRSYGRKYVCVPLRIADLINCCLRQLFITLVYQFYFICFISIRFDDILFKDDFIFQDWICKHRFTECLIKGILSHGDFAYPTTFI